MSCVANAEVREPSPLLSFAQERLVDCIGEIRDLAPAHYAEVGGYSAAYVEGVDWESYLEMDRIGVLLSVIARVDGKIIGYWGGTQHCDLHSGFEGRRILAATQIVFFILPSWRRVAKSFCRAIERIATSKGMSWVAFGAATKRTADFFRRIDYKPGETLWIWVNDDARGRTAL